jgi:hypothetical protein
LKSRVRTRFADYPGRRRNHDHDHDVPVSAAQPIEERGDEVDHVGAHHVGRDPLPLAVPGDFDQLKYRIERYLSAQ